MEFICIVAGLIHPFVDILLFLPLALDMYSEEAGQVRHFPKGEGAATGTVIPMRLEDCRKLPLTVCALALRCSSTHNVTILRRR